MKIEALRLFNVRRFAGRGVAIEGIGEGVNVLCAANEYGKSTSFEALHALFFAPHTSTAGDVRALRPYSGGNPLVQADISTTSGRFRITKQFHGGRLAEVRDLGSSRLVAQADEAESFIGSLVKGGAAGPAGLLWVRQGVTGIERRSKTDEENEKQVRASLLQSVQGEVEAVTGGRRMDHVMAAVDEQLAKLVTPKERAKAGGPFAAAVEDRDRLQTEAERLSRDVERLRSDLDRRAAALRDLSDCDSTDGREARLGEIREAEAAVSAAREQAGRLREAEAELKLAQDRRGRAAKDLSAFRDALARAADLRERQGAARTRRNEMLRRRDETDLRLEALRERAETAEAEENAARDLLDRLDRAMKAREAHEQLAGLERALADAEATRGSIETAEAELARLALPDTALSELGSLEIDITALRATMEAVRPTVSVAYERDGSAIVMDGAPLRDGESRTYSGTATLQIPGVGMLALRSSVSGDDDDRLRQALEKRRVLLAKLGVDDLGAARRRQDAAARIAGDVRELKQKLAFLAPEGLAKLRELVAARRAAAVGTLEVKGDPEQVRAALNDARERREAARRSQKECEPVKKGAADAFLSAEAALAGIGGEIAQVDAALGPTEERDQRMASLTEDLAKAENACAVVETEVARLRAGSVALERAEARLKRLREADAQITQRSGRLREEIAGLDARISTQADLAIEEQLQETAEALAAAEGRVAAYEREVAVLRRLKHALDSARSHARDTYLLPVMNELRPLLGMLFPDASITFDEKTLLPQAIRRGGQEEEIERLSGGTREQLSVLTRLAFARLLARDGRPAPVILDDALVYSDDDRIEAMFDALHGEAQGQQIIVFSCRQRAFQRLGGRVLSMVDWTP